MKRNISYVILACVLFCISCVAPKEEKHAGIKEVEHVVFIGLDGWGAYSMPEMDMPTVKRFMDNGTYADQVRSVLPSSSAVNWASIFMGAGPELHGYTTWGSQTPDLPPRVTDRYGMFPTIFALLRDQKPDSKTGIFYEWDGISYLFPKQAVHKYANIPAAGNRSDSITLVTAEYIRNEKPAFTVAIFDQPDGVGHKSGHNTPEYYEKLKELDSYIGIIEQAVIDAGIYEKTLFIVTADHGGIEKGHGGKLMEEMQVPLVYFGAGVKKGQKLDKSIMQFDNAATLAYIFGLEVPQVWIGRPVTEAFE